MNAKELFDLAPFGAYVKFSDGTPRPPDRFNIKLREWTRHNAAGYFVKKHVSDGVHDYSRDDFALQTLNDPALSIVQHFDVLATKTKEFVVELPKPGTILACTKYHDGDIEVRHVWQDVNAARTWARRGHVAYKFPTCGYEFYVVANDGTLKTWTPPEGE